MVQSSTAPALFAEQDAFKGAYAPRFQAFTEAAQQAGLGSAQSDTEKIAVILVDYQHDFVDPTGTLYVPGSQQDVATHIATAIALPQGLHQRGTASNG